MIDFKALRMKYRQKAANLHGYDPLEYGDLPILDRVRTVLKAANGDVFAAIEYVQGKLRQLEEDKTDGFFHGSSWPGMTTLRIHENQQSWWNEVLRQLYAMQDAQEQQKGLYGRKHKGLGSYPDPHEAHDLCEEYLRDAEYDYFAAIRECEDRIRLQRDASVRCLVEADREAQSPYTGPHSDRRQQQWLLDHQAHEDNILLHQAVIGLLQQQMHDQDGAFYL